jgi:uncharacterized protein (DUF58 family)
MQNSQDYLDPNVLARVQGLELRARLVVEGYLSGLHPSPNRGFSVEFAQHREYVPGDDIRHVDWKVYARTERYVLKQHDHEAELACWLLLDVSESMHYASGALSKYDIASVIGAALAHLLLRQGDSVGLITFDDRLRDMVQPSGQRSQLKEILSVLNKDSRREKTHLGPILNEVAERIGRRSLVVLLSDLFDDVDEITRGLRHLRHEGHEVILFHVLDRAELAFPFVEPTLFSGLEELPDVATDPLSIRRSYLARMSEFLAAIQQSCRDSEIDYVQLPTDASLGEALSRYLAHRPGRKGLRHEDRRSAQSFPYRDGKLGD